ncbi:MAG: acetyl-CoA carboxylase biotin carboxylase subunit, partial [Chloroflexia bacterium]|nr:acetyl-CoA carboxylase biotin carboxylase subunit [Chloroflexia bacterium]
MTAANQDQPKRLRRVLIANRGEIAVRVARACRELGIETVAVYGDGEESALHVRYADDAFHLPTGDVPPYLNIEALIDVARRARADAVHPGYGFLAENAAFARACDEATLVFVGPSPDAMAAMGDKVEARRLARAAGVNPVPGSDGPVASVDDASAWAREHGFPVAVKASAGGGGRGFRVAHDAGELAAAFAGSSGEGERYFGNAAVYLERYLEHPRHVEVQVFADAHGTVVALGERDCSVQRRHQKLIEESPSPAVTQVIRDELCVASERLARAVDYRGAGTVEYLLDADGSFYFLEMNTRIQVEHPVTEMITGIDLIKEQLRVAMGHPLSFGPARPAAHGWAIECRINAEDAGRGFAPAPGTLTRYREPAGFGVRVDSAMAAGEVIQARYDSLIAKLIVWGRDREEATARMRRALDDFTIEGVPTTIPFHRKVFRHKRFRAGEATTTFLAEHPEVVPEPADAAVVPDGEAPEPPVSLHVEVDGRRFAVAVSGLPGQTGVGERRGNPPRGRPRQGRRGSG